MTSLAAAMDFDNPYLLKNRDGSIAGNLYCLECGYNLRGLYGDPVRCPECGHENDLGTAAIPAEIIEKTLRNMETTPTLCCALMVLGICATPWLPHGFNLAPVLIMICVAGWATLAARMKSACHERAGWKEVLFQFHVATLLGASPLLGTWLSMVLSQMSRGNTDRYGNWFLVGWFAYLPLFIVALWIHRTARRRLDVFQRETAVEIARQTLMKSLRRAR